MDRWDELSMREKAGLIKIYVRGGFLDLANIRSHYNYLAEGGPTDVEVARQLSSNISGAHRYEKSRGRKGFNFVERLQDPNRQSIKDWTDTTSIATHKLSYRTNDDGSAVVYPEVQEIDGKLVDFTRPPYHPNAGWESARANKDYIDRAGGVKISEQQAKAFTKNYKEFYPNFIPAPIGHKDDDNTLRKRADETSRAYWLLRDKGYSAKAASAIIGNLFVEGRMDPFAIEKGNMKNKGEGIAQWTNPTRKKKLHDYYKYPQVYDDSSELERQVEYLDAEVKGRFKGHLPDPKKMKVFLQDEADVDTLTELFMQGFEKPKDGDIERRRRVANYIYNNPPERKPAYPIYEYNIFGNDK